MKKISIRKKILAILISSHIMLTGCSFSGKITNKEHSSSDSSFTYSSIDENTNINSNHEDSSSIESSLDSMESSEESIVLDESVTDEESDKKIDESSIEENYEEISEEVSIVEESSENSNNLIEEVSIDEITEDESSLEESHEDEISEEVSFEDESSEELNEKIEESSEEIDIVENSKTSDSYIEESHEDEYDGRDDVYTDDDISLRVKDYVNLRPEPNPNSKLLDLMCKGDTLKKLGYANDYYIVEYNGKKVYIAEDYVEEIKENEQDKEENIITNEQNNTNLSISDICYFPNGSTLYSDKQLTNEIKDIPSLESAEIYYQDANAYYVETDGDRGYVSIYSASIIPQPAVVVDESDQTLKLYKDNTKKMEFPVVTGNYPNYATSKGLFNIKNKVTNANLVGPMEYDYTTGEYKPQWDVTVYYWMGFTDFGEGIHDAVWRPYYEFGGTTYQGNGSHGCVNCMYDDVMALAEEVEVGDKVLVKR